MKTTGAQVVPMTQSHIDNAKPHDYTHCVIADVMRDAFPNVHGATYHACYFDDGMPDTKIRTSQSVRDLMSDFDNGRLTEPVDLIVDFDRKRIYLDGHDRNIPEPS